VRLVKATPSRSGYPDQALDTCQRQERRFGVFRPPDGGERKRTRYGDNEDDHERQPMSLATEFQASMRAVLIPSTAEDA
jgi:hypothetical protein